MSDASVCRIGAGPLRQRARQIFVGKVDLGLDQSRRFDQLAPPALIDGAQSASALAERLAALALGLGVHEVGKAFGFGQVELAVLEGAAGEFAGLRQAERRAGCRAASITRRDHRRAAMDVEFGHVFAGEAVRGRETRAPGRRRAKARCADRRTPRGWRSAVWADRGPSSACSVAPAAGPDRRITATPARPAPDASATMVSGFM